MMFECAVRLDGPHRSLSGDYPFDCRFSHHTLNLQVGGTMEDRDLIERLKRDIEDWREQARFWENLSASRKDAKALAKKCRAKAEQWSEVIKVLLRN